MTTVLAPLCRQKQCSRPDGNAPGPDSGPFEAQQECCRRRWLYGILDEECCRRRWLYGILDGVARAVTCGCTCCVLYFLFFPLLSYILFFFLHTYCRRRQISQYSEEGMRVWSVLGSVPVMCSGAIISGSLTRLKDNFALFP